MPVSQQWKQFVDELEQALAETARRSKAGYDLAERMPPQTEINRLTQKCLELTHNLALMYVYLIRMSIAAEITFYPPLPTITSADGYLTLIDAAEQRRLGAEYATNIRGRFVNQGGRVTRGRSAIDNTVAPNIFLMTDGRRFLARQGMMRAIEIFFNLVKGRSIIDNYGQLSQPGKEFVWQEICDRIPKQEYPTETQAFMDFTVANPGAYFANDPAKHKKLLFSECARGNIKVLARSTTDKMTIHRFVEHKYCRLVPLKTVTDGMVVELRLAGTQETLYLRANEGHYLREYHGMSLTGGEYTKLLNLEIPQDLNAFNRTNRYPDFEWLTVEAEAFNANPNLPGTMPVMVGRNSCTGSSIKQTAHGQQVCATLNDFKHFAAVNNPQQLSALNATVDVIQVGSKPDACLLKLLTSKVHQQNLLEFINGLIIAMQLNFGDNTIDFQIQIIPADNQFAIIFIPFAMLTQSDGVFINPTTGDTNLASGVTEHLHLGNSCGRWGAVTSEQRDLWLATGQESLKRLYDFTALASTSDFMSKYLADYLQRQENVIIRQLKIKLS